MTRPNRLTDSRCTNNRDARWGLILTRDLFKMLAEGIDSLLHVYVLIEDEKVPQFRGCRTEYSILVHQRGFPLSGFPPVLVVKCQRAHFSFRRVVQIMDTKLLRGRFVDLSNWIIEP